MSQHRTIRAVAILALVAIVFPTIGAATHETADERAPTPLAEFRDSVGQWIDPWLENAEGDLADDHAPLVAISLYEELLGIKPKPCYRDAYAAYWAVAADIRAMGQAPNREQQLAEIVRIYEDVARAGALAEISMLHCAATGADLSDVGEVAHVEATPAAGTATGGVPGSARVIEIEATASLQFTDGSGDSLETIAVTPGETILFRVYNSAGFDHNFYIGTESQLDEPQATTDVGIPSWYSGVRELEWAVPDDISGLMYGCTVPGHFPVSHGTFTPADGVIRSE